jgi:hypothetical protein
MQLEQIERTVELLNQRLLTETDNYRKAMLRRASFEDYNPLFLKAKKTLIEIKEFNKKSRSELNKEIKSFDMFRVN